MRPSRLTTARKSLCEPRCCEVLSSGLEPSSAHMLWWSTMSCLIRL
jgi:hypothetical protein